jgi:hypothetical protein
MAKVKEEIAVTIAGDEVKVLWYSDDEEGYGVEIWHEEATIEDFSFGHTQDAYEFSFKTFHCIAALLKSNADETLSELAKWTLTYPEHTSDLPAVEAFVNNWIKETGAEFSCPTI